VTAFVSAIVLLFSSPSLSPSLLSSENEEQMPPFREERGAKTLALYLNRDDRFWDSIYFDDFGKRHSL